MQIASLSFADDLVLVGCGRTEIASLTDGYLRWCALLRVRVTKVQLWSSLGAGQTVPLRDINLTSAASFRFVGIELGLREPVVSKSHFAPRIAKATAAANRLRTLPLPAAICSTLWRTAVLPQALYGCQIRHLIPADVSPLLAAGKSLLHKAPLQLNLWRSPDIAMAPSPLAPPPSVSSSQRPAASSSSGSSWSRTPQASSGRSVPPLPAPAPSGVSPPWPSGLPCSPWRGP